MLVKNKISALAGAVVMAAVATSAGAQVVYTNTVETGSRFNPGSTTTVMFDDVPVAISTLGGNFPLLQINRITIGFRQVGATPAFTWDLYAFAIDGTGDPVAPLSAINLAPISVTASTASRTVLSSFGDGVNPIATVPLNYAFIGNPADTFATIAVGVKLNTLNTSTGWRLTSGTGPNVPQFGLFDLANPGAAGNGYGYGFGAPPQPAGTFYIVVEGVGVIPEPSALGLLAPAGLVLARRRRA